ncbi:MAG: 23S rRNA (uracil(1939)-C(5))-methyltransferase RlmD, partial [Candidatus Enterenecus sp.]
MALTEGGVYRAVIGGCAGDGAGVARVDGMVVFVKGGIRGETADICIEHIGHNAAWAHIETLIDPSPARVEPDCPYYTACGGCQFRHMTYAEELEAKRIWVEDALTRLGGADVKVEVIHGGLDAGRYRNKVQFPVGRNAIGYYRGRTHQVIDIEDCLLQPELDTAARRTVKEWMERFHVPAFDEKSGKGLLRHLYLRTNSGGEVLCCLVVNGRDVPHSEELTEALRAAVPGLAGLVLSVNTRKTNVILGDEYRTLWGRDWLEETLCGHTFRLSVPSFFQINRAQTEVLYGRALEFAGLTGTETVVDLYCGIGTISLTMAERAGQVIGVEVVPQAIEDAKENARRNGLSHKTRFECGDASDLAARLEAEGVRPDVVVVDPPRKGLAPDVVDTIARMAPARVVYVSCDPATLGRDVGRFAQQGYTALRAEAVDLFPRTAHVETVCLLSKLKSTQHIEVELDMDELDLTAAEKKATYDEIKDYVLEHSGLKVSSLYIAQVKQQCGII